MFIWIMIVAISIPGILFMSLAERKLQKQSINDNEKIPIYVSLLTHTILVLIFSGMGTVLIFKVVGKDIFFIKNLLQAVVVGIFSSCGHLLFYYGFYKRFLDKETFIKIEQQRNGAGLGARVLYGGVIEEIIFRWGIMTFIIWIMSLFVAITNVVIGIAIVLSSILFAVVHFVGISEMKKSKLLYSYVIVGNIWVGVFCGWQFWTNGIFAAMIVHMLFHLLLYPFELWNLKKLNMSEKSSLRG
ncbi:CPBP family intramembrane glutamic endopeptidase [Bacillus mycoides]|uniref:CPBP family intramembrane glutamic endopeptidase n=1 Tax=Bacillus mycoides TaxID=1405 RepID=UPI003D1C8495